MVEELTSALTAGKKRCPNGCKWTILILSKRPTMSNWVWTGKLRSYVGEGGKQGKDCSKQVVAYEPNSAMNIHRTHHRAGWVGRHSQEGNTAHTGTLSLVLPQLRVWMSRLPAASTLGAQVWFLLSNKGNRILTRAEVECAEITLQKACIPS